MTLPLDGAATVALGLSPWILPLIAIAAKRKEAAGGDAGRRRILLAWWRGRDARADTRARQHIAVEERLKARVEAVIWPD